MVAWTRESRPLLRREAVARMPPAITIKLVARKFGVGNSPHFHRAFEHKRRGRYSLGILCWRVEPHPASVLYLSCHRLTVRTRDFQSRNAVFDSRWHDQFALTPNKCHSIAYRPKMIICGGLCKLSHARVPRQLRHYGEWHLLGVKIQEKEN